MNDTKNYLVIGGNSGIGAELVTILQSAGHRVITASRNENPNGVSHIQFDALNDSLSAEQLPEQIHG